MMETTATPRPAHAATALELRAEVFRRAHCDHELGIRAAGGDRQAWILALSLESRRLGLEGSEHHLAVVWGLAQLGCGS